MFKKFIYFLIKLSLLNFLPGLIRKKYLKEKNVKFIPSKLKVLPENNHPILVNYNWQEELIVNFKKNKRNSVNSYDNLEQKLLNVFDKNQEFNFLDFGGDKIDLYLHLNSIFKNIKYFLINQKDINSIFKDIKLNHKYNNLFVLDDVKNINDFKFDFVFFGSVIQYIKNYQEVLSDVIDSSNKYILISATHFYENKIDFKEIIVKQINFLPKEFYLYFINLDNLLNIFKKKNFELIEKTHNNSTNINYSIFDDLKLDKLNYYNLFFKKK